MTNRDMVLGYARGIEDIMMQQAWARDDLTLRAMLSAYYVCLFGCSPLDALRIVFAYHACLVSHISTKTGC